MAAALEALFSEESATALRELIFGQVRDMENSASRPANLGGIQKRLMAQSEHPGMLNSSQSEAFAKAMECRLSLIQGPPGTGKTHTAVRILAAWARNGAGPILAVADSNLLNKIAQFKEDLKAKVLDAASIVENHKPK